LREKLYPYRTLVTDPAWHDYDDIPIERVVMNQPDLPATLLRLPVIYGPEDQHFHRTFHYLKRMDDGRPVILLDMEQANHQDSRVYVEDAAWAIALTATDDRARGRIYNVAPKSTLTGAEWVERLARAVAWQGKLVPIPRGRLPAHLVRDRDFRHHLALSSERIRHELGYSERIPFEVGLHKTITWQRAHPPDPQPGVLDYEAEDAVVRAIGT
jgi:nucleoside-diphosphate-sugar epimerase